MLDGISPVYNHKDFPPDAREFSRLQSAAYNATGEERKAAQKEFDDYVERHSKKRETAEEEERQTHKRSRGRSMGM